MKKTNYIIIGTLVIAIFSLSVLSMNIREDTVMTNSSVVSNEKMGWGIKRGKNNEQPDVGSNNRKVLEENKGICLGSKDKKIIYLTFDEGYEAGYTKSILKTLKDNNVKAAFFITAHYINSQPDLVKQMIEEGHIVGNHIPLTLMTLF